MKHYGWAGIPPWQVGLWNCASGAIIALPLMAVIMHSAFAATTAVPPLAAAAALAIGLGVLKRVVATSAAATRKAPAPQPPPAPADLAMVAHDPADLPRRLIRYASAVTVTCVGGQDYTQFGAHLSRAHIRDRWTGYGLCHADAVDAVCNAWQITVIDPEWSRDDRLWPVLEQFAATVNGQEGPDHE